ncbi:uncharacterized protein [Dysidea avara]|uniref:uncharacterized protein n=1 Tax=Dysidea avara TaxID=196820 RepID=UPI003323E245
MSGFYNFSSMVVPISKNLADCIKSYLTKPEFCQMVMHLLGEDFVSKYLSDLPFQPAILHPAYMSSATIQLLRKDAFQWLQQQIATVCKQLNIVLIPESTTDVSVSVNQQQFISHTADTLQCNIVRECLIKSDHESFEINWWNSDNGLSCQNDVIGDGMLKICLQSPASFITRKSQFIGYGLPNKLRPWTWKYLLELHFSNQQVSRHPVDYKYVPHKFMEKFAELRITKPVQNSMDDLISKTTLQMFHSCPSLIEAAKDKSFLPSYCAKILSQLSCHGYQFNYTQVLLTAPFLVILVNHPSTDPVSIVAYLSVFFDTYLPGVNHMRNIAMRVSNHLSNCEAALHSHVNGLLSAADVTLIAELLSDLTKEEHYGIKLECFIHKWISTCFVEILNLKTLLFVWDHLFLSEWSYSTMEDLCVIIIKLMKTNLLATNSSVHLKRELLSSTHLITSQEISSMIRKQP